MKRCILISLVIFMAIALLNSFSFAYTGEIDPNGYITFPSLMSLNGNVATGKLTISSSASGYNVSYQKVDMTKEKFDQLDSKNNEIKNFSNSAKEALSKKQEAVNNAQKDYNDLLNKENATEAEKTAANEKLTAAKKDYTDYYNEVEAKAKNYEKEYLALIPDYTDSWTNVKDSTNEMEVTFSNTTGMVYYVMWTRLSNGTDTYYDYAVYSTEIRDNSDGGNNNGGNNGNNGNNGNSGDNTGVTWTDFSNASFELKKNGVSDAYVEISGAGHNEDHSYYMYITSNSNKPNVDGKVSEDRILLSYDKNTKKYKTLETEKVRKVVELNQDLFANVLETEGVNKNNLVVTGKKLTRFNEPRYSDAFHATFISNDADQIVTLFTHYKGHNRKMQIKVGKVTDTSILQKIKDKDTSGFANLLNYAKSGSAVFNQTVDADKDDPFAIEYNAGKGETTGNSILQVNGLEDKQYYYLYVKLDDENGKYAANEAVTLCQANVYSGGYGMHFYGATDFNWTDWGGSSGGGGTADPTVAPSVLPNTGANVAIILSIAGIVALGVLGGVKVYKYRDIK